MPDTLADRPSPSTREINVWAVSSETRCVIMPLSGALELRLECGGKVIRRGQYADIRQACDAARRWRIDWDIEARASRPPGVRMLCPECGDDVFEESGLPARARAFCCSSCGEAWTIENDESP